MTTSEVHVERLIGKRVRDIDGRIVGRIEEIRVDVVDGEAVVTEWHIGPAALIERLGGAALQLPFLSWVRYERFEYRVPWQLLDVSRPDRPRLRRSKTEIANDPTPPTR